MRAKPLFAKTPAYLREFLGPALQTLAKTYDFQVLYRTEVVGELRTRGPPAP